LLAILLALKDLAASSCLIYVAVASLWLVPDRRIERALREVAASKPGDD
jgi:hypothetical protein